MIRTVRKNNRTQILLEIPGKIFSLMQHELIVISDTSENESYDAPDEDIWVSFNSFELGHYERCVLLRKGAWFNDELINAYFAILAYQHPEHYFMNTFFVTKLTRSGVSGVIRWANPVKVSQSKIVFIPVNLNNAHWILVIVEPFKREITLLDSMATNSRPHKILNCINDYFVQVIDPILFEPNEKSNPVGFLAFQLSGLRLNEIKKKKRPGKDCNYDFKLAIDIPQQEDGGSCGTFVCKFASLLAASQEKIEQPRRQNNDDFHLHSASFNQTDVDKFRMHLHNLFEKHNGIQF